MATPTGDLITPKDAARMLDCSISQLFQMVSDGLVKEYRQDAAVFFNRRELAGISGVTDVGGVYTTLPPDRAVVELVQHLAVRGATVTTQTSDSVTGVITMEEGPDVAVAIVLFLMGLLPGILYVVLARRSSSDPFALSLTAVPGDGNTPGGTLIHGNGQGAAVPVLNWAADQLPS